MALALDIRYSQYCFRTELQIILDNITILLGIWLKFAHLALTELVTKGLGRVG